MAGLAHMDTPGRVGVKASSRAASGASAATRWPPASESASRRSDPTAMRNQRPISGPVPVYKEAAMLLVPHAPAGHEAAGRPKRASASFGAGRSTACGRLFEGARAAAA